MNILDEYEMNKKLSYVTADSASNNDTLCSHLSELLTQRDIEWDSEENQIHCITHVINIIVDKFIDNLEIGVTGDNFNKDHGFSNYRSNNTIFSFALRSFRDILSIVQNRVIDDFVRYIASLEFSFRYVGQMFAAQTFYSSFFERALDVSQNFGWMLRVSRNIMRIFNVILQMH